MRTLPAILIAFGAAILLPGSPSSACSFVHIECSRNDSVERCIQIKRAARAKSENCRNDERSFNSAERQADVERRSDEFKARQRSFDQADAQRRARDDQDRATLNGICAATTCKSR